MSDHQDVIQQATVVLAAADVALAAGQKLLTVPNSVRWLAAHGIRVHENTVRHWYNSGRIQIVRRAPAQVRSGGRRAEVLIPLQTLERIACCPFCAGR